MPYRSFVILTSLLLAPQLASSSDADQPARLESLSWLAGDWGSTNDGVVVEEHWSKPWGGVMVAVHRDELADGRLAFEFLRIEETEDGLVYLASPQGRCPPTPFALVELGDRRVVFANPEHDFPQRLVYWIADDGALHARAEGGDGEGPEWRWERR